MGLRFRKSVSILPGVRLNFGKSSASVSVGVPGFRKTINTKGQVTTTVGIPGTGIYYVDTKKTGSCGKTVASETRRTTRNDYPPISTQTTSYMNPEPMPLAAPLSASFVEEPRQISTEKIKSIHKSVDDSVDWTEVLCNPNPPDETYNREMWRYYHSVAGSVLNGDIDTYLQVIYEVNPLDDLLDYGTGFEFGTDSSKLMEVEFVVNDRALSNARYSMSVAEYNDVLQDFVCSTAIRVARDMFALLPIKLCTVHAVLNQDTILSVQFDRQTLTKIRFNFADPSEVISQFTNRMDFSVNTGFCSVERV